MKKFIFNADDLGLSPRTTQGIVDCSNVVKSASLMVTSETAEDAFNQARRKDISVGIHLNVSGEGGFIKQSPNFGKSGVVNNAYNNNEPLANSILDEIFTEFNDQLELFESKFNVNPTHVNFHHPLYKIPNFTARFKKFAEEVCLPTRWFYDLGEVNIPHPNETEFGFFNKDEITVENLINIMHEAPEGITEFILHPGLLDQKLNSTYVEERSTQVNVLTNPKIIHEIEKNKWSLISFDDIR